MERSLDARERARAGRRRELLAVWLLMALAVWGSVVIAVVYAVAMGGEPDPDKRAIITMGVLLVLVWCVLGGAAMRRWRRQFVALAHRLRVDWRVRFVALCILLALAEEAVTTSLTNLAPLLGGVTEAARITASRNYFVVVLQHSVIAFVPLFLCWAWLLSRYDFRPIEVMLLYGLNGVLAETLAFGPQNLLGAGMWVFVYGLMVWLPAHTVPAARPALTTRWRHWALAAFLPLVFVVPLALYLAYACARFLYQVLAVRRARGQPGLLATKRTAGAPSSRSFRQ